MTPRLCRSTHRPIGLTISGASLGQVSAANAAAGREALRGRAPADGAAEVQRGVASSPRASGSTPASARSSTSPIASRRAARWRAPGRPTARPRPPPHATARRKRAAFAGTRRARLLRIFSFLVVENPSPPPGLLVTADGKEVGATSLGTEIPFDAGPHKSRRRRPDGTRGRRKSTSRCAGDPRRRPGARGQAEPTPATHLERFASTADDGDAVVRRVGVSRRGGRARRGRPGRDRRRLVLRAPCEVAPRRRRDEPLRSHRRATRPG